MSTRTLPRHNPPTPKGVPGGQIIAVALLLTFSLFPRAFILGFWIFSDQIGNAFSSWIALVDSVEYKLYKEEGQVAEADRVPASATHV